MSGQLVSTLRGKIPQRAIRYLGQLPYAVTYQLDENVTTIPGVDFGAGDEAFVLRTPATLRAKPMEVAIYKVSETFTTTTLEASVEIGDGSDQDEFAYTDDFGALAAATPGNYSAHAGSLNIGDTEFIQPADLVTVTCVAPTGGTPAGRAQVAVTFLYFE